MSLRDEQRDGIWAISERCVSCGSCEDACRGRRGLARLTRPRHGHPVVFPEICRRCKFPACVDACISSALARDPVTGDLQFSESRCVACWSCIMACPYGAVRRDVRARPTTVRCDRCASYRRMACVSACPTRAMQGGRDEALRGDLARAVVLHAPLVRALACVVVPLIGLLVGLLDLPWIMQNRHAVGIAAGGLMVLSLLLPFAGMAMRGIMRRSFWSSLHVWAGTLAAAAALAHTGGRFGANAQTLAALLILVLVAAGGAYRYLRPLVLIWQAVFYRDAAGQSSHNKTATPQAPSVEAMAAGAAQARAWRASLGRLAAVLAACKTLHIVLAVAATGLVLAHVISRLLIGAD